MRRCHRLAAVGFGLLLWPPAQAAGPERVELVSPPPNAVVPERPFYVICKGAAAGLTVDGQPQPWAPFAAPLHVARLRLEPGRHEIAVGERKVAVWVEGDPPPAAWGAHVHSIAARAEACGRCHETAVRDGLTAVGAFKSFDVCLECHKPAQFEAKHSHPLDPLKHCGTCHTPHGSVQKGLLKAPAKQLCASCHDA